MFINWLAKNILKCDTDFKSFHNAAIKMVYRKKWGNKNKQLLN